MDKIGLYQEMLIEAMKRRINAAADEQNALRNLFNAKISFIWNKIANREFLIDGRKCIPSKIKWYESHYNDGKPYVLNIKPYENRTQSHKQVRAGGFQQVQLQLQRL